MLKPKVGDMVLISSPKNLFTIVVLPALSRPLHTHTHTHTQSVKERITQGKVRYFVSRGMCTVCIYTVGYSISILTSFSFCFIFFRIESSPIVEFQNNSN